MRDVILEGVEDKIRINLGGDVSLVAEIQRIGRSLDWLVSEVELTGEEVLNLIDSIQFGPMWDRLPSPWAAAGHRMRYGSSFFGAKPVFARFFTKMVDDLFDFGGFV